MIDRFAQVAGGDEDRARAVVKETVAITAITMRSIEERRTQAPCMGKMFLRYDTQIKLTVDRTAP